MPSPRRSPPIYVLNGRVDLEQLTGDPGQGWTRIECGSKKAYGCGEHGQEAVQGLALYARLGDAPLVTSPLAIRMTDEALRIFDSESEPDELDVLHIRGVRESPAPVEMDAVGHILVAEPDLIVIRLIFRRECLRDNNNLSYFLVYDNVEASLSMINDLPDLYQGTTGALLPVPNRTIGGGACELLLMACELAPGKPPVLCVFSSVNTGANDPACPWRAKGRRFPLPRDILQEPFMATMAFSFQGKGFLADLAQGLMYCDLPHATSDHDSAAVDSGFIGLPGGCELNPDETLKLMDEPTNLTRIVGCGGDSICFVCIDRATEYEDDSVTMWTLKLPHRQWKEEWKFSARELWGFDGFKEAGLPKAPPEFPVLTADGGICLVLTDQRRSFDDDGVLVSHTCSIDVPNKRVLWHGQVHNYPFSKPVAIPSSFFQRKHSSHKRKFGD